MDYVMSQDGPAVGDYGYAAYSSAGKKWREPPGWGTAVDSDYITVRTKRGKIGHYNRHAADFVGFFEQDPDAKPGPVIRTLSGRPIARKAV